jgi:hypothetical protein
LVGSDVGVGHSEVRCGCAALGLILGKRAQLEMYGVHLSLYDLRMVKN